MCICINWLPLYQGRIVVFSIPHPSSPWCRRFSLFKPFYWNSEDANAEANIITNFDLICAWRIVWIIDVGTCSIFMRCLMVCAVPPKIMMMTLTHDWLEWSFYVFHQKCWVCVSEAAPQAVCEGAKCSPTTENLFLTADGRCGLQVYRPRLQVQQ